MIVIGSLFLIGIAVRLLLAMIPYNDIVPVIESSDLLSLSKSRVPKNSHETLCKHNSYYKNLSSTNQEKFRKRLQYFLAAKRYYAPKGIRLTNEMKVVCASLFAQVTFGLEKFQMPFIRRVIIYPVLVSEKYYSREYKSLTTKGGVLRIGWKYIVDGLSDPFDGQNIGLFELGNALQMIVNEGQHIDDRLARVLSELQFKRAEIQKANGSNEVELFNDHTLGSRSKFFGSCVELFFERPNDLAKQHKSLFDLMCYLLNQDTSTADYSLSDKQMETLEEAFGASNKATYLSPAQRTAKLGLVQIGIVSGLFVGYPILTFYFFELADSLFYLVVCAILISVSGIIFLKKSFFDTGYTNNISFALLILFGYLPLVYSFCLVANDIFTLSSKVDSYPMRSAEYDSGCKCILAVTKYDDFPLRKDIRCIPKEDLSLIKDIRNQNLIYQIHVDIGLLGFKVFDFSELKAESI